LSRQSLGGGGKYANVLTELQNEQNGFLAAKKGAKGTEKRGLTAKNTARRSRSQKSGKRESGKAETGSFHHEMLEIREKGKRRFCSCILCG
jgi:hypothetical protein